MTRSFWRRCAAIGMAGSLLCSCKSLGFTDPDPVNTSEEVANVYVSAYPAVPWEEIVAKLEPKHNLTTAEARQLAAVTTQEQASQFVSAFGAGLAIGLPSRSTTRTVTTTDGVESAAITRQLTPGTVAESSGAAAASLADAALAPDLSKGSRGIDGATQLLGGTAIFQLAGILDNQLTKGWKLQGYQANLITFQVNVQPLRRDLAYDTYINLSLVPGDWDKAIAAAEPLADDASAFSPVIVYPLVIADAMESGNASRSSEIMRQAALRLSGILANIGLSGGLEKVADRLDVLIGSDRNSLTTVGRISDHAVRIRLGAQLQGSNKLAMVPRSQNISMVVFTRSGEDARKYIDRLAVLSDIYFADAKTGVTLRNKNEIKDADGKLPENPRIKLIDEIMKEHDLQFLGSACGTARDHYQLDILRAADRGDYAFLSRCLGVSRERIPPDELQTIATARKYLDKRQPTVATVDSANENTSGREDSWGRLQSVYKLDKSDGLVSLATLAGRVDREPEWQPEYQTFREDRCDPGFVAATKPVRETTLAKLKDDGQSKKILPARAQGPSVIWPELEMSLRRAVADLMLLQTDSRRGRLMVALPFLPRTQALPDMDQLVLVSDDKKSAKAVLRGARNLRRDQLRATLLIGPIGAIGTTEKLLAESVTLEGGGAMIAATFPSLSANGLTTAPAPAPAAAAAKPARQKGRAKPAAPAPAPATAPSVSLVLRLDYDWSRSVNGYLKSSCYKVRYVTKESVPKKNPLLVTSDTIVADRSGHGTLSLASSQAAEEGVVMVQVTGADVRSSAPEATFNATLNAHALTPAKVTVFKLGNLTSARPVRLQAIADKAPIGDPVVLTVQPENLGKQ